METIDNNVLNFAEFKKQKRAEPSVIKVSLGTNKKLLIVEDDEILLDVIKKFAMNYFDEIYSFESAEKALLFIKNKNIDFDLSLVDFFLPGNNGGEVLNELKNKSKGSLFIMSGDLELAKKSVNTKKANGFLQKPLSFDVLNNLFNE